MCKHENAYIYKEDQCLIVLACDECRAFPLAEFNNGCKCPEGMRRDKYFIGWNGIQLGEAQALLDTLRSK